MAHSRAGEGADLRALCLATGINDPSTIGQLHAVDLGTGAAELVTTQKAITAVTGAAFDSSTGVAHYLVAPFYVWHYAVARGSWASTMLNLTDCSDGTGGCVSEPHWDPGANAIVAIALGYPRAGANAVVWVDPDTGSGRVAAEFPAECGVLSGGTAFDPAARTFYATLECQASFQIFGFDLTSRQPKPTVVYSGGESLEPIAIGRSTGTLFGFGGGALNVVLSRKEIRVVSRGLDGLPGDGTAVWFGRSMIFVQMIRRHPAPPAFIGVNVTNGAATKPRPTRCIYDACLHVPGM